MLKHVTREGQLLGPLWDKLSDTLFAMFSRCRVLAEYVTVPYRTSLFFFSFSSGFDVSYGIGDTMAFFLCSTFALAGKYATYSCV